MVDEFQNKLSQDDKNGIAQNLIEVLQRDINLTKETKRFISHWILSGPEGKTQDDFDIWDIVLRNYLPTIRPVLFRACDIINKKGKIASFTGRLECARRISKGRKYVIICDTKETLKFEKELFKAGEYRHTFYPLVNVLIKDRDSEKSEFSDFLLNYINEDEYIMKIDFENMHHFKWVEPDL